MDEYLDGAKATFGRWIDWLSDGVTSVFEDDGAAPTKPASPAPAAAPSANGALIYGALGVAAAYFLLRK